MIIREIIYFFGHNDLCMTEGPFIYYMHFTMSFMVYKVTFLMFIINSNTHLFSLNIFSTNYVKESYRYSVRTARGAI